jgi:L-ascorbate peroxidase
LQADIVKLLDETNCLGIMVRLAWHDSGTYNKDVSEWPKCGGANGA